MLDLLSIQRLCFRFAYCLATVAGLLKLVERQRLMNDVGWSLAGALQLGCSRWGSGSGLMAVPTSLLLGRSMCASLQSWRYGKNLKQLLLNAKEKRIL